MLLSLETLQLTCKEMVGTTSTVERRLLRSTRESGVIPGVKVKAKQFLYRSGQALNVTGG